MQEPESVEKSKTEFTATQTMTTTYSSDNERVTESDFGISIPFADTALSTHTPSKVKSFLKRT